MKRKLSGCPKAQMMTLHCYEDAARGSSGLWVYLCHHHAIPTNIATKRGEFSRGMKNAMEWDICNSSMFDRSVAVSISVHLNS